MSHGFVLDTFVLVHSKPSGKTDYDSRKPKDEKIQLSTFCLLKFRRKQCKSFL